MKSIFTLFLLLVQSFLLIAQIQSPPDINPFFSAIIVQNIETSVNWYSEILSYEVFNQTENEEFGIKQANLTRNNALLELIELNSAISQKTVLKDQPKNARISGFFKLGFEVSNFDEWIQFLNKKKVELQGNVVIDPNSKKRMVIILDPDGNRIQLFDAFIAKESNSESEHFKEIREDLTEYFRLLSEGKLSACMEYIHPGLFEIVPKETMVEMMGSTFEDPELKISIDSIQVTEVSEVVEIEEQAFARVGHRYQLIMKPLDWPSKEELNTMVTGMGWSYGEDNIKVDDSEKNIRIQIENIMIAFHFPDMEHWYFLENSPERKGLYQRFIPQEVVDKLDLK